MVKWDEKNVRGNVTAIIVMVRDMCEACDFSANVSAS